MVFLTHDWVPLSWKNIQGVRKDCIIFLCLISRVLILKFTATIRMFSQSVFYFEYWIFSDSEEPNLNRPKTVNDTRFWYFFWLVNPSMIVLFGFIVNLWLFFGWYFIGKIETPFSKIFSIYWYKTITFKPHQVKKLFKNVKCL